MQLSIIRNENFGDVQCDFYANEKNEIWMTRDQIGVALGYSEPRKGIQKIHERYKDNLDEYSVVVKLGTTDGKAYDTYLYSAIGVYEICRWSRQPHANKFMKWVWSIIEDYRNGRIIIAPAKDERFELEKEKVEVEKARIQMENNRVQLEKANSLMHMYSEFKDILSQPSLVLVANSAVEMVNPQLSLPKPQIMKSYTATQIADSLGISRQKVGRLANLNNLKIPQNGMYILDRARHANKQVENFLYNENGKRAFQELLSR